MSETKKRILIAGIIVLVVALIAVLEHFGINAARYAGIILTVVMMYEFARAVMRAQSQNRVQNWIKYALFGLLLVLMLLAVNKVGQKPWIILLLFITICSADIGAWLFGRIIGGDKMWKNISEHKTWAGQISGIICGTFASIMYGLLGTDTFLPQLLWIGISVSLLSQYGDLTASYIKRKLEIKDFGTALPGHGGFLDRFDGWIYVLPIIWFVML
ncbi:MAG: CDP-archaeol synthase [Proteobacteria bacterium]|nr:CDP-archaeol synthase [Candidatus Enterousia scatequi]